jgi:hypothetical protein
MYKAISEVLTDYPVEKTAEEIIEMIESDDMDEIVVYEPYEDYYNASIVNLINEMADNFASLITDWEEIK